MHLNKSEDVEVPGIPFCKGLLPRSVTVKLFKKWKKKCCLILLLQHLVSGTVEVWPLQLNLHHTYLSLSILSARSGVTEVVLILEDKCGIPHSVSDNY